MNTNLYEVIGRQAVEVADLRDNYRILLMQIERMRDGNLSPEQMVIDHAAQTWRIEPKPQPAASTREEPETPTA